MAHPKWHIVPTLAVVIISVVFYTPLMLLSKNLIILLMVIGFGVFLDADHFLSFRRIRIKALLAMDGAPIEGWTNEMHDWPGLIIVAALSIIVANWLPFISYAAHILIDGANRANLKYPRWSPLPTLIHRLLLLLIKLRIYPKWLTYCY